MLDPGDDYTAPDGGTKIRLQYGDARSPTHEVVKGVAALQERSDTEIDPLYDRVQTEAMNTLIDHAQRGDRYVGVEFTLEEYAVVVTSDGTICITDEAPVTRSEDIVR
ncbi:HalOD1 output domain-containing protein [Natrialbaceae archaeon A-arb3/5]